MCAKHDERKRKNGQAVGDDCLMSLHRYVSLDGDKLLYCPKGGMTVMKVYKSERNHKKYLICAHCCQMFGEVK